MIVEIEHGFQLRDDPIAFFGAAAVNHSIQLIGPVGGAAGAIVAVGDIGMPRGFRAAALYHGFIPGNNPGDHGVMVPAGFLMLDACAETADGAAVLEAAEQGKHVFFGAADLRRDIGVGREAVRQIRLYKAKDGAFLFC